MKYYLYTEIASLERGLEIMSRIEKRKLAQLNETPVTVGDHGSLHPCDSGVSLCLTAETEFTVKLSGLTAELAVGDITETFQIQSIVF